MEAEASAVASSIRTTLAGAYLDLGRLDDAHEILTHDLDISANYLGSELPTMSEGERLRLFATLPSPNAMLSCLVRMDKPPLDEGLRRCIRWKGTVTRIQRLSRRLLQEGGSPENLRRIGDIQALDKKLSELLFLQEGGQAKDHGERITALRKERVQRERSLNRDLGLEGIMSIPSLAKIQAALPPDGVLLDFFVGSDAYVWVLKPKGAPVLLTLGESAKLRRAHESFLNRTTIRGVAPKESDADRSSEYFKMLWKPVEALVAKAKTVFVSPDGFLCELPFGTLQRDGKFLLEDHRFVYLSDVTQLVGCDGSSKDRVGSLLIVGDVDYYGREEVELLAEAGVRSRVGQTWPPLSGTREELESLRALHERVLRWTSPLVVLDQKAACEERVRGELPGKRYVHIATHGFFEPDHLPSLMSSLDHPQQAIGFEDQRIAVGILPGFLSGLVLSGVNADPDPARDDGYLSAEEIEHLDLIQCDLAVLSACETALGSERAGNGLMSLRRAFEVAGAKTVISSLWKVDDRASATLMRTFYENYWRRGLPKNEALHRAKLESLRQNRADYKGDARPETWGSFVLSGDWE
jgi:CHAT domain-containing protein